MAYSGKYGAFRAEDIVAAILQGVDVGSGPLHCILHHGPSDVYLTLHGTVKERPTAIDIWLDGDLPEAAYRAVSGGQVLREGRLACWLDHTGGKLLGPAPADNPAGWNEFSRKTCRIMAPQPGQLIQAISWCGHRVHEVPGHGPVDCPECLAALAEDADRPVQPSQAPAPITALPALTGQVTVTGTGQVTVDAGKPPVVTDYMVDRAYAALWCNPDVPSRPPYAAHARNYVRMLDEYTGEEKQPGGQRALDLDRYRAAEAEAEQLNRAVVRQALEAALVRHG